MKLSMKVCLAFVLITVVSAGNVWAKEKVIVITGVGEANVARVSTFESVFDGIKEGLRTRNIKPEFLFVELVDIDDSIKQCRSDMIYMLDTSRVDSNGPMEPEELVRWTVDNTTVPVIAATRDDVKFGALLSIVSSDKDIGLTAARIALKILGGARPSEIPYASSTKGTLMINTETARQYGTAIPRDILSKAKTYPN